MFALLRMKTQAALFAGLAFSFGSSPLIAGMDCSNCLDSIAPTHALYCGSKNIILCEDGCHGKERMKPSIRKIPDTARQTDWGQKYVNRENWVKTPYETTFSPIANRYQFVVAKLEINLSPIRMSFRLPRVFQLKTKRSVENERNQSLYSL